MSPKTFQRKRTYLINRDFQLRYVGAAVVVGVVSTFLTATVILYPLYVFQILRIPRFLPLPILMTMGFAALLNVVLVAFMGIFMTHKIAGPMYSLVRGFRRIENGIWGMPLRLRHGDELQMVIRNYNEMAEALRRFCSDDIAVLEKALADHSMAGANTKIFLLDLRDRLQSRIRREPDVELPSTEKETRL